VKPNAKLRLIESNVESESADFAISIKDSAHIMNILRSTLYSDKVKAVLREYSTNAWDAHRDAGKEDLPIKVELPTTMDPTLIIRDYGSGLSQDDVFNIYTQYGASTKRSNDNTVGMLGIGSKSGFAYSDSFTITSFFGGRKKMYVAVLDESEKGKINLLDEGATKETGIEIRIAIRPEDILEFDKKAKDLFQYFKPKPEINTDIPDLPKSQLSFTNGVIYDREHQKYEFGETRNKWVAVMGCIPYIVDLNQLKNLDKKQNGGVADFLFGLSGALFFKIGEVEISASRETLKYSDITKKALVTRLNELVDEYVQHTIKSITEGGISKWETRVRAQVLTHMHLPVPKEWKDFFEENVSLKDLPDTLRVTKHGNNVGSIYVSEQTRLIIRDDARSLKGFELTSFDYVVYPETVKDKRLNTAEVRKELDKFCKKVDIEGVVITKTSELAWSPARRDLHGGRTYNSKHHRKCFKYKPDVRGYVVDSARWEPIRHHPDGTDVFVIISSFKSRHIDLSAAYSEDSKLAEALGHKMPEVVGYKTTLAKPLLPDTMTGQHYPKWRTGFHEALINMVPTLTLLNIWDWANILDEHTYGKKKLDKESLAKLMKTLGKNHPIPHALRGFFKAKKYFRYKQKEKEALGVLKGLTKAKLSKSEAELAMQALLARYPLFGVDDIGLEVVWGEDSAKWLEYVQTVDKALGAP
jgi:hypothetical protein